MTFRLGAYALILSGAALQAAPDTSDNDSEFTGLPKTYPRAKPVELPATNRPPIRAKPRSVQPEAAPVPPAVLSTPPMPPAQPEPVTSTPILEPVPTTPSPSTIVPKTNPPDVIPPTPMASSAAERPLDEVEARKQVVVLETSLGRMVIELDDVAAPRTCGNFRKLVASGFYNHTIFHRVIPQFMIQGGDPITKSDDQKNYGQGDPGYTLPAEIGLKPTVGAVAMARLPDAVNPQRDSNGSQFFICAGDCPTLEDQYTIFGHVIRGLDAISRIANQPRDSHDNPTTRIEMQVSLEIKKQALEENPR